jgi:hypothetical protein
VRLEQSGKFKKKTFASSGLEPETFWLVAQCELHSDRRNPSLALKEDYDGASEVKKAKLSL